MPVHKVFVDSRAAKEGTDGDFVWAPDRPLSVGRCRAFIDSVHMPVSWGSIVETNRFMYIAEEMPVFTVLPTQAKVYLRENGTDRVLTIAANIVPPDDGPGLAQALAIALGAGYTTSFAAGAGTLGTISVASATPFVILSRASLLQLSTFAGSPLVHSNLQDANDILGTTTADATNLLTLGQGLDYRRIELSKGSYTMDSLAVELATQLNNGTALGTYTVGTISLTSRLTISNPATLKFHVYPTQHLDRNPFSFQGFRDSRGGVFCLETLWLPRHM